jgi:signal-transduction protein with cAMP-binding, CBS, and nucleotidyltransferase domain
MEFLSSIYPFSELDKYALDEAYKKLEATSIPAGQVIKDYDDPSKRLYIIQSGEVGVFVKTGYEMTEEALLETYQS